MEEVEELIKEGKITEALKLLKGLKDSPEKFYYICLAEFKRGKLREALTNCEKALKEKQEPRTLVLHAYILYTLGYEEGIEDYISKSLKEMDKALLQDRRLEDDVEFLTYKANALYELGKYGDALNVIDKAISLSKDMRLHKLRGDILFKMGKYEEAIGEYQSDLQNDENLYALGFTYYTIGDYGKALEFLDKALEINPENPYYYETKSQVLLSMGKTKEAFEEIKKALQIDPDNPYLVSTEIEILSSLDKGNAIKVLSEYLKDLEEFGDVLCEDLEEKRIEQDFKDELLQLCKTDRSNIR
ncbi:tetratricopeptide repeat protein [Stygiolobus caldivivus]|uniref:Tetratricopeptide repeat protein n=1 Tax=Stygiolobus caldivivus TaxID=2824673 RepID=A0A8D5ZJB5_9CREN|nr:tetratricopeptide repeat protein [Stygiolobus caldivivus]BCU70200.1 hypothetical protein KN1_14970 [Stygiolobus caldivivus]